MPNACYLNNFLERLNHEIKKNNNDVVDDDAR